MIKTAFHLPGDTASVSSVLQAKRWLRRCSATHANCGSVDLDVPLPTRLIHVEFGLRRLRLVETKGMRGRYACLSHCWGDQGSTMANQTSKTTRMNRSSNLENIDFTSLPRTFIDAVVFTKKLGLKYLWIDSLCIVQDDQDDWRHEASLMASIYENAVVTLGATASASSAEGLFRSSSSIHEPIELRGKTAKGKGYVLYGRSRLNHWLHDTSLFKRGWILQERFLSPRFLHFASNELIWECRHGMDCECSGQKLSETTESNPVGYFNAYKSNYLGAFTASPFRVQVAWRDVVNTYSQLNLSHAKDKLPALSGIAKKFTGIRPGDRYLAGLWESSFVEDLLWRSISTGKKGLQPRPDKWRAPTWSWASVDSAVGTRGYEYNHGNDHGSSLVPCIDVLAVNCVPAGEDITGELSSGYVVLRGWIMAARLRMHDGSYCIGKGACTTEFFPDYQFDVDDDLYTPGADRLFCLRVAAYKQAINNSRSEYILVLRGKRDTIGIFERVGLIIPVNIRQSGHEAFDQLFESRRKECIITIV
ncbi:hypothetical protein SVAN01_01511 [Stagonosporopsis vannaccii]|nr:hypothetical protein SVAN01_01511 [Stagonosporopsis vannaccii]